MLSLNIDSKILHTTLVRLIGL